MIQTAMVLVLILWHTNIMTTITCAWLKNNLPQIGWHTNTSILILTTVWSWQASLLFNSHMYSICVIWEQAENWREIFKVFPAVIPLVEGFWSCRHSYCIYFLLYLYYEPGWWHYNLYNVYKCCNWIHQICFPTALCNHCGVK